MPLRKGKVLEWFPAGITDSYDSTFTFQGACTSLSNLVFDQGNPEAVISRPGVTVLTSFPGFTTPGFVSLHVTVGPLVYGFIASGLNVGFDQPFCFNTTTGAFVTLTGVTSGNVPTSPPTSGAWVPPSAAVIGTYLILTHPGYSGTGTNFFGVINLSTNAYSTSNLGTHALPSVPTSVANFNNRAYFAIANQTYYSDSLSPLVSTNAGQILTFGDTSPVTAMSGLPVTTSTAGVIQALIVFKTGQIWQVTGDPALSGNPIAETYLSLSQGTSSPRSVCQTTRGTFFIGTDGPMIVDSLGNVRALTNQNSPISDLRLPFINVTVPSRVEGDYASNVYRVCVPTVIQGNNVTNDYWFDVNKGRWNGPHSFPYDCSSAIGNSFILSSSSAPGKLFSSYPNPNPSTVYTDNGVALTTSLQSSAFPMSGDMDEYCIMESVIELASAGASVQYTISLQDTLNDVLSTAVVTTTQQGALWGSFVWGRGTWSTSVRIPNDFIIPWPGPVVSDKFLLNISASSSNSLFIGALQARAQPVGYTLRS